MSKADKANEPSMDEILASIRKIIAEEPAGSRKPAEAGGLDPEGSRGHPTPRASLDDILGMADSKPSQDRGADLRGDGPSWPFSGGAAGAGSGRGPVDPARSSPPAPSAGRSNGASETTAKLSSDGASEASPRPLDLGTIVPRRPSDTAAETAPDRKPGRLPDWLSRPTPLGPVGAGELPPPTLPGDAGRPSAGVLSASAPDVKPGGDSKVVIAPPPPTSDARGASETGNAPPRGSNPGPAADQTGFKAPESLAGLARPSVPQAAHRDRPVVSPPAKAAVPAAAAAVAGASVGAKVAAAAARPGEDGKSAPPAQQAKPAPASPQERAAAAAIGTAVPTAAMKAAASPAVSAASPEKSATSVGGGTAPVAGAPVKAAAAAGPAGEPAKPAVAAAANAAGDKAAAAPASETAKAVVPSVANGSSEKAGVAPVPVAEPATAVAKPAVMPDKAKVAKVSAADLVSGVAGGGVRTLDDTIIELLRPMIRQWLDDNMPRMVEKALRIELAASLQAKGEAAKGDASKH